MSSLALLQGERSAAAVDLPLFGEYSLADPMFLALVPLLALALWRGRRRAAAARVPALALAHRALPRSLRQRLLWLPTLLQALALAAVTLALARPLRGNVEVTTRSEGVDIALLVDRSSSMAAPDLDDEGVSIDALGEVVGKSRLEVVKEVVGEFARRRMTARDSAADNVGLITFAQYPELLVPFTLDADSLLAWLAGVAIVRYREEDGTAIGAALAKAVAVLTESEARSRVVVLLTDGENTVDDIAPLEAAQLAAEEGIRVYAVAAGRYRYQRDVWNGRLTRMEHRIDTSELRRIAELTGGRFYRAHDRAELEGIYAEIEELERTPREERRFEETFDLYPWLLLAALCLYTGAWLSSATWARRLP